MNTAIATTTTAKTTTSATILTSTSTSSTSTSTSTSTSSSSTSNNLLYEELAKLQQAEEGSLRDLAALYDSSSIRIKANMVALQSLKPRVFEIGEDSVGLSKLICETCSNAEVVVKKVRELDLATSRTNAAIKRVDDIVGLKTCIEEVNKAIESEAFEVAASALQRYLGVAPEDAQTEEVSIDTLKLAESNLRKMVKAKCEKSLEERDGANVFRFCKLQAALGMKSEGLGQYMRYLGCRLEDVAQRQLAMLQKARDTLAEHSKDPASKKKVRIPHAEYLTKLFETVAQFVADNEERVQEHFGPQAPVELLLLLQEKSTPTVLKMLEYFLLDNEVVKKVALVSKSGAGGSGGGTGGSASASASASTGGASSGGKLPRSLLDPLPFDALLEDMALLIQRCEQYDVFVQHRYKSASTHAASSGDAVKRMPVGEGKMKVQEVIGHYIKLEEHWMRTSVAKAIRVSSANTSPSTAPVASPLVDDVFFILKKCTRRSLSTSNVDAVCSVVNNVNTLLSCEVKDALNKILNQGTATAIQIFSLDGGSSTKLETNILTLGSKIFSGTGGVMDRNAGLHFDGNAFNNLELAADYTLKLKRFLDQELTIIFGKQQHQLHATGKDVQQESRNALPAYHCVAELVDTSSLFKWDLGAALTEVATSMGNRLDPIFHELSSPGNYTRNDVETHTVHALIALLQELIEMIKNSISETNLDHIIHTVVEKKLIPKLEHIVFSSEFNHAGALRFDTELRTIIGYISGICTRTVRDKFARLTQIALILSVDKIEAVNEMWADTTGSINWRLPPQEVRKVLSRRIEWSKAQLQTLKL